MSKQAESVLKLVDFEGFVALRGLFEHLHELGLFYGNREVYAELVELPQVHLAQLLLHALELLRLGEMLLRVEREDLLDAFLESFRLLLLLPLLFAHRMHLFVLKIDKLPLENTQQSFH